MYEDKPSMPCTAAPCKADFVPARHPAAPPPRPELRREHRLALLPAAPAPRRALDAAQAGVVLAAIDRRHRARCGGSGR